MPRAAGRASGRHVSGRVTQVSSWGGSRPSQGPRGAGACSCSSCAPPAQPSRTRTRTRAWALSLPSRGDSGRQPAHRWLPCRLGSPQFAPPWDAPRTPKPWAPGGGAGSLAACVILSLPHSLTTAFRPPSPVYQVPSWALKIQEPKQRMNTLPHPHPPHMRSLGVCREDSGRGISTT